MCKMYFVFLTSTSGTIEQSRGGGWLGETSGGGGRYNIGGLATI